LENLPAPITLLKKNDELNSAANKLKYLIANEEITKSELLQKFSTPFQKEIILFEDEDSENFNTFKVLVKCNISKIIVETDFEKLIIPISSCHYLNDNDFILLKDILKSSLNTAVVAINKLQFHYCEDSNKLNILTNTVNQLLELSTYATDDEVSSITKVLSDMQKSVMIAA